jgi:hypothetical protein
MSIVMPPLLHSAQLKPDVTITDADANESDNDIESDDGRYYLLENIMFFQSSIDSYQFTCGSYLLRSLYS